MFKKILRGLFTIIGLVTGYLIGSTLLKVPTAFFVYFNKNVYLSFLFVFLTVIIFGIIFFLLGKLINMIIYMIVSYIEKNVQKVPANEIIFGILGAITLIIIITPIVSFFAKTILGTIFAIIIDVIAAIIGADIGRKKRDEFTNFFLSIRRSGSTKDKKNKDGLKSSYKVLDTSVIIDGRIFDLCKTGFIEGTLVVPNFVLEELRHIADSSDALKRNRGRRGMDVINKIQNELDIDVEVSEKDFPNIKEVDAKLLKLAQVLGGKVVTNDYNLNKVAKVQKVPVLNINELANAIKPVVLPGEEMTIQIVKDGKESGQGVAYLDDGTMIVVEGGRKFIGETKDVVVTSVLQTAAGRMIFAKQKENSDKNA